MSSFLPHTTNSRGFVSNYATDDDSRIYIESSDDDDDEEYNAGGAAVLYDDTSSDDDGYVNPWIPRIITTATTREIEDPPPIRGVEQPLPVSPRRSLWAVKAAAFFLIAALVSGGSLVWISLNGGGGNQERGAPSTSTNQNPTTTTGPVVPATITKPSHQPTSMIITQPTVSPTQSPSFAPTVQPTTAHAVRITAVLESSSSFSASTRDEQQDAALDIVIRSTNSTTSDRQIVQTYAVALLATTLGNNNVVATAAVNDTTPVCEWPGVVCDRSSSEGASLDDGHDVVVTGIVWPSQNLSTTQLPNDIQLLTDLQYLDLGDNNRIGGSLPRGLYQLTSLRYVYLHNNALTGPVSPAVGQWKNLQKMFLGGNRLSGPILDHVWNTTQSLEWLSLHGNKFTGTLPQSMQWPRVHTLDLGRNQLRGTLPPWWFNGRNAMSSLQSLYLDHNKLTGAVPERWYQVPALEQVVLNDNDLTGEFPGKYVGGDSLRTVEIYNNKIDEVDRNLCKISVYRHNNGATLSTLRTDCDTCSCGILCDPPNCVN